MNVAPCTCNFSAYSAFVFMLPFHTMLFQLHASFVCSLTLIHEHKFHISDITPFTFIEISYKYKCFQPPLVNQLTAISGSHSTSLLFNHYWVTPYYITYPVVLQFSLGLHFILCHLVHCFGIHFSYLFSLCVFLKAHSSYIIPSPPKCILTEVFAIFVSVYNISCFFVCHT